MIKYVAAGAFVAAGLAFAAGCYVGWKTTLRAFDAVAKRHKEYGRA